MNSRLESCCRTSGATDHKIKQLSLGPRGEAPLGVCFAMRWGEHVQTYRPFALVAQGFFPRVHEHGLQSRRFYNSYLQTYIERDVRTLINLRDTSRFQNFLTLLAGRVGQIVNYASLANDVGVSATTIKNWIAVLKASFVLFELPPYFANIRKRVVKSPKIYFTDVGLAAFLLGIHDEPQAYRDPLRGQLYENMIVADIVKSALNKGIRPQVYFYRDSHSNEIDLLIAEGGELFPIEIKSSATFSTGFLKGFKHFSNLKLPKTAAGHVLFNGEQPFQIHGIQISNPLHSKDIWSELTSIGP